MPERERELKVVRVDYVCDRCGVGTMAFSDKQDRGYDCSNIHVCSDCGEIDYMDCDVKYPTRRYRLADVPPALAPDGPRP
jgi:hypothetical protein